MKFYYSERVGVTVAEITTAVGLAYKNCFYKQLQSARLSKNIYNVVSCLFLPFCPSQPILEATETNKKRNRISNRRTVRSDLRSLFHLRLIATTKSIVECDTISIRVSATHRDSLDACNYQVHGIIIANDWTSFCWQRCENFWLAAFQYVTVLTSNNARLLIT